MFVQSKMREGKINDKNGASSEEDGKRGIVIVNILLLILIYVYIYQFCEINI